MHSLFQGLLKPWPAGVFRSSEKLGPVLSVEPRHTFVNETFASEFTQPLTPSHLENSCDGDKNKLLAH